MKTKLIFGTFLLFFLTQAHAKEWTGYFQSDFTSSENPSSPKGFQLRRVNIIYNKKFLKRARALVDVEYENGAEVSGGEGTGEIKLSRGFIEFTSDRNTSLLAGKFLTPFGIYNEIHDFSASYTPIDPPSFYQKHQLFETGSPHRLISKYSTGVLATYKNRKLVAKAGLANGQQLDNQGADKNRSPMIIFRGQYGFFTQSHFGISYQRDKVETLSKGRWQDILGADLQLENQNYLFQTEYATGRKWNRSSTFEKTTFESYFALFGRYISDSWILYARFSRLIPNIELKKHKKDEYGVGINYFYNYFTIVKWEGYQEEQNYIWDDSKSYFTNKLSLSVVF